MNSIKKIARLVALSLAVVPAMAFSAPKNIVETAASIADFSTLVSLVKQADLAGALSGKGPFTVLAPSNKAFAKLPKAVVERITGDKDAAIPATDPTTTSSTTEAPPTTLFYSPDGPGSKIAAETTTTTEAEPTTTEAE